MLTFFRSLSMQLIGRKDDGFDSSFRSKSITVTVVDSHSGGTCDKEMFGLERSNIPSSHESRTLFQCLTSC